MGSNIRIYQNKVDIRCDKSVVRVDIWIFISIYFKDITIRIFLIEKLFATCYKSDSQPVDACAPLKSVLLL